MMQLCLWSRARLIKFIFLLNILCWGVITHAGEFCTSGNANVNNTSISCVNGNCSSVGIKITCNSKSCQWCDANNSCENILYNGVTPISGGSINCKNGQCNYSAQNGGSSSSGNFSCKSNTTIINQSPVASFTISPNSGTAPLKVQVNASSSNDPDGRITGYEWQTSNGLSAGGLVAPSFYFATVGNYIITLTVRDDQGATDSASQAVTVESLGNQLPIASFTMSPNDGGIAPLKVSVDATSSFDPDGSIISYQWETSNGLTANGMNPSFNFTTAGNYTITLTVTDNDGLTNTTQQTVVIGSTPPPTGSKTLILTNYQKLVELYGSTETDKLMTNLDSLAGHNSVQGQVIHVESDPTVAAAYRSRGSSYDDRNRGNAVAEAIKQVILTHWDNSNGALQYLVFVGDDRVIPFYRIVDGTPEPDPMTLTDDFYSDRQPTHNNCYGNTGCAVNPELFIPDLAVGRLIENPRQIIGIINTFLDKNSIELNSSIVTGYALDEGGTEFLGDGAKEICRILQVGNIPTDCSLVGTETTTNDFVRRILGDNYVVRSVNSHANYNTLGELTASDVLDAATDISASIFYTVGCHAGQNVSSDLDLPESFASRQVNYIANTGYGWGSYGINNSELLMQYLTEELVKPRSTLGMALINAKQTYHAEKTRITEYDEKVVAEVVLWGLPMYQLVSPPNIRRVSQNRSIRKNIRSNIVLNDGLERNDLSYSWDIQPSIEASDGSHSYSLGGKTIADLGKPLLPKFTDDIKHPSKDLHGVIFRGGRYLVKNSSPILQRFFTTTGYATPINNFYSSGWYPSKFFTSIQLELNNGNKQTVVAAAGQYNPNLRSGQQRVFYDMDFDAYYHTASDWTPPVVYLTDSKLQSNLATIGVTASDAAGIAEIVVAYTDGQSLWNSVNLTASGVTWSGNFAANADTEFFVQAVDSNGNVAVNDNDGKYFKFDTASTPKLPTLGSGKSINPAGVFANSNTSFKGGASTDKVNYQTYLTTSPSSDLTVKGHIIVDPADVGKQADLLYVVGFENQVPFDGGADTAYFTIDESGKLYTLDLYNQPSVWMNQLATKPFKRNVTLQQEMVMDEVNAGQLLTKPSVNYYFMGYRLQNGTLVYTSVPIIVNVQ